MFAYFEDILPIEKYVYSIWNIDEWVKESSAKQPVHKNTPATVTDYSFIYIWPVLETRYAKLALATGAYRR